MASITLGEEKFTFEVDWHDTQACIIRKYRVFYYPVTRSIEMFDIKNMRMFLKKQQMPGIELDDFYIGSQVTILARVLKVTDYGDVHTRARFETDRQRTFAMIKPDAYHSMGKIIDTILQNGFKINKLKLSRFNRETAAFFYKEHTGKPFFDGLVEHQISDVVVGMELVNKEAINLWR